MLSKKFVEQYLWDFAFLKYAIDNGFFQNILYK